MAPALHEGMAFFALRPERILQRFLDPSVMSTEAFQTGEIFEHMKRIEGERDVPEQHWPVFVRFRNLADPGSAEPVGLENHGVSVRGIRIAITSERVTRGIKRRLPWLRQLGGPSRPRLSGSGRFDPAALSTQIDRRSFSLSGNEA
jgi:hypothetical protein